MRLKKITIILAILFLVIIVSSSYKLFAITQNTNDNTQRKEIVNDTHNQDQEIVVKDEKASDNKNIEVQGVDENQTKEVIPPEVIKSIAINYFFVGLVVILLFAIIGIITFLHWYRKSPTASKKKLNLVIIIIGILNFVVGYIANVFLIKIFESLEFLKMEMLEYVKEYYYNILLDSYPGVTFGLSLGLAHFLNMLILFIIFFGVIFSIYAFMQNRS
jgi:hypothetical protein